MTFDDIRNEGNTFRNHVSRVLEETRAELAYKFTDYGYKNETSLAEHVLRKRISTLANLISTLDTSLHLR